MKVGIPKEISPGERRVAATPDTATKLIDLGFEVIVESGAGIESNYYDAAFEEAGATIGTVEQVWGESDLVLKVEPPTVEEAGQLREGAHLISFIWPDENQEMVEVLKSRQVTCIAMERIPRITRAQKMDARSSMDNIRGYRSVIEAANEFGRFFTGQITAAGKIAPAKVLIVGAGVAGLAALGAAKGLGAIVRAFDVRAAAKDQVKSLGGEFLEVKIEESGDGGGGYAKTMSAEYHKAQMDLFFEQAKEVDVVITTALIPGRDAPILWEKRAVEAMKPGSVVVDIAAPRGGNCELTEANKVVEHNGVKIVGYTDLPSRMSTVCSQLYGTNLWHLLSDMTEKGSREYIIDMDDEIVRGSIFLQDGAVVPPPPKADPSPAPEPKTETKPDAAPAPTEPTPPAETQTEEAAPALFSPTTIVIGLLLIGVWGWLRFSGGGMGEPTSKFLQHLTVFVMAVFVGWQVIWNVAHALHTPLMSVTNAISGIIIVGGLLQANQATGQAALYLGLAAVFFATINIAGGFLVTKRMLQMFRK